MCTKRAPAYWWQETETVRRVVFDKIPSWAQQPTETDRVINTTEADIVSKFQHSRLFSSVTLLETENVFFYCPGIAQIACSSYYYCCDKGTCLIGMILMNVWNDSFVLLLYY